MSLREPKHDSSFDVVTPQPESVLTIKNVVIFLAIVAALSPLIIAQG